MSSNASPAATPAVAPAAAPATSARREARRIALVVGGAIASGVACQAVIGPGPRRAAATALIGAIAFFAACQRSRTRWRETLTGFRFTSVLLLALSAAAVLGTLFVQGKPAEYYPARYGAAGSLVLALRLDDVFHSLWFAALVALFAGAAASSAATRLAPRLRNVGFVSCHAGLLLTLAGAAASSAFTVRGRVDLRAGGESTRSIQVMRSGAITPERVDLGFDLQLDRFDLVNHDPEFRVAYYEPSGEQYRLRASFDPEVGERHLLPRGDSFTLVRLDPDVGGGRAELRNPGAVFEIRSGDRVRETPLLFALRPGSNYARLPGGVLVFERRADEARAFVSHVTLSRGDEVRQARVAVNEPLSFDDWTFYQANYDPRDPTYSGLDAVRDPGVRFVFLGFLLIFVGVVWMLYFDRWLERVSFERRTGGLQP